MISFVTGSNCGILKSKKGKSITCSSDQTPNPETTKTDLSHKIAVYFDLLGFMFENQNSQNKSAEAGCY